MSSPYVPSGVSELPWTWFSHLLDGKPTRVPGAEMHYLMAANGQGFAHTVGLDFPTDEANASYIVTATKGYPEALRLLEEMLEVYDISSVDDPLDGDDSEWKYIAARALLAQAREDANHADTQDKETTDE